MASLLYSLSLLIFSITYLLLISLNTQPLAHLIHHNHKNYNSSTPTIVTKRFSFSNFHLHSNSSFGTNDIVLLGSAGISNINGSIQIPYRSSPNANSSTQAGRAIFAYPIHLFDTTSSQTSISFSTTFSFQIITTTINDGTLSTKGQKGGGLAFIIVSDEITVGRPGPWLGMVNDACEHHKMFGVEFDTNYDQDFGDPSDDHIGINLGSIVSIKTIDLSQSTQSLSLHDKSIHRAWIQYNGEKKWIDIYLGHEGDAIPTQPILSSPLYLNKDTLNEHMFIGFSASTEEFSSHTFNILSWNFSSSFKSFIGSSLSNSEKTCFKNVLHQVSKYAKINNGGRTSSPNSFQIFVSFMGLFSFSLVVLYCNSNKKDVILGDNTILPKIIQHPISLRKTHTYTIYEIYRATRGFSEVNMLGSDSIGTFYKGTLPNGSYVSMKRIVDLNMARVDSIRAMKRINMLVQVCHHERLAPIRGWCFYYHEIIVVYDYFQNGSLEKWLYGIGVLPWSFRVKIVHKIAESLYYLHSKGVVHGNLRMSSIFLDTNCYAILGDYALCKINLSQDDTVLNGMRSDVVAFGMIVIEILVGKKIVKLEGMRGEIGALEFTWIMHERGEKVKVFDEKMMSSCCVEREQALHILKVGMICSLAESGGNPSMEEVMKYLDMEKPIPKLPPNRPT